MKDGYVNKRVTFDIQDGLEEKIDRLTTLMSKLTAHDDGQNKQFKPKMYQNKRRGQMRNFHDKHTYDQRNYQNRYRSNRKISFSGRILCGQNYRDRPRHGQNYRNNLRRGNFRGNPRTNQNFRGQNYIGGYRENYRTENHDRGRSRYRERYYQVNIRRNNRCSSSRSRSGLRARTNRDRIRCCKCREYDHFTKDCPMSKLEKETDQIQEMFNMDEEQTAKNNISNRHISKLSRFFK